MFLSDWFEIITHILQTIRPQIEQENIRLFKNLTDHDLIKYLNFIEVLHSAVIILQPRSVISAFHCVEKICRQKAWLIILSGQRERHPLSHPSLLKPNPMHVAPVVCQQLLDLHVTKTLKEPFANKICLSHVYKTWVNLSRSTPCLINQDIDVKKSWQVRSLH